MTQSGSIDAAPYRDPARPLDERVSDLLARMTTAEKIGQMMQVDARGDLDGDVGERFAGSVLHTSPALIDRAQDLAASTRLGIPVLVGEDCIHGHSFWPGATIFPTQLAMAASWDPELVERVARATAVEVSATGVHWTFSPVLCVARDLRWGRVGETFGEDPHLIGELASAMVRGYQGKGLGDPTAILATAKHFAGYSETQGGRDASEADISRRKLRSWFLPPFERVAREGCATFMLGYQTMDGIPITVNGWLLDDVLRGEWAYEGMLVTDWDNVGRMVWEQRVRPDIATAARDAVRAGNDLVMTTPGFFDGTREAIARGDLTAGEVDAAVTRILRLKFALGLFENARRPDRARQAAVIGAPAHAEVNLEIARRSIVLLRNRGGLPLRPDVGRVLVTGPLADAAQTQLGDWAGSSGQVGWMTDGQPRELIHTVLDGVRDLLGDERVVYARGAGVVRLEADPAGSFFDDGQPRPRIAVPEPTDPGELDAALIAAAASDVVVAVVGDTVALAGEGRSTATLELQGGQTALLESLISTGRPVIVVLLATKPLVLPACVEDAEAVVWAASPGMLGGRALAEVLLGIVEPSGRLPISFPRHVGQQPTFYNQVRGQHGDRYADLSQEPMFAFGEGLSYSAVQYGTPIARAGALLSSDVLEIDVTLRNSGGRPVREIAQLYVRDLVTSASWADRELKAFLAVDLPAGGSRTVTLQLDVSACSIVDADGRRVVEPGEFEALVGPSSRLSDLQVVPFRVEREPTIGP